MSTSLNLIAIALLLPGHCLAQGRIVPLTEADRGWAVAQEEARRGMEIKGPGPSCITNKVQIIGKIDGEALTQLFPGWQFISFSSSLQLKQDCPDKRNYSIPGPSRYTIAIPPKSSPIAWKRTSGFDSLLVLNDVHIRTLEEARLVWEAYCEYHQNRWEKQESKRFSENEWRLGISSYDQTVSTTDDSRTIVKSTHYVQVKTEPKTGRINFFKSQVEQSNKRTEHVK